MQARRLDRDLKVIVTAAAAALVDQYREAGLDDPADIARRLNRKGFPCHGRTRWTRAAVVGLIRRS